jgi:hypothetical protein
MEREFDLNIKKDFQYLTFNANAPAGTITKNVHRTFS